MSSDADSKEYIRTGIFPIGKQGQDFEGSKVVSARYFFDWLDQLHQPACFLNESGNLLKHSLINICSFRCIKLPHMPIQMHKALAAFGSLGVFRKAFLPPLGSSQML